MDTLSDTDEGKGKPSVWPVYVAAAVIGLVSMYLFSYAVILPVFSEMLELMASAGWRGQPDTQFIRFAPYALTLFGLLGLAAVTGAVLLRSWGWWCATVWTVMFATLCVFIHVRVLLGSGSTESLFLLPVWLVPVALIVWPLATRRRLFFPPKPEGEE